MTLWDHRITRPIPEADASIRDAASVAGRALKAMETLRIPATPNNFAVWYACAAGSAPDLKRVIESLIGNGAEFDKAVNKYLHESLVGTTNVGTINENVTTARLTDHLDELIACGQNTLRAAIADNRSYLTTLGQATSDCHANADPEFIISHLIEGLRTATDKATALEAQLSTVSHELDTIRNDLRDSEIRSNTDSLTGLANRRRLDAFLLTAVTRARDSSEPLSILLVDIDRFKSFNDRYGHQTGDQVLHFVAKILKNCVRNDDLAARYGGEELMAILPGADLKAAKLVAERTRARIADARLTRRATGEILPSITVSVGVSQLRPTDTIEDLISRCDQTLYKAKDSGRNRIAAEDELADAIST